MLLMIIALSFTLVSTKPPKTDDEEEFLRPLGRCRPGWTYFSGSCYAFGDVPKTWDTAASSCVSQGSYLVEINSQTENKWIVSQLRSRGFGSIWAGATEEFHRGTWQWASTGDPFKFTDWATYPDIQPSDPPGVVEDCLEIRRAFGYKWNDLPCGERNKYVCETR